MFELEKVIIGCKKQRAESQKLLYQQYFSVMMSICLRYANNTEDAEELMNNGFLKIFVNINSYEGKGSFEGWMKKTMVNNCLDYFKSKQYKTQQLFTTITNENDTEGHIERLMYSTGNFEQIEVNNKYNKQELLDMLNILPPLTKTVFNLVVFEEYSHKEVANEFGISERTSQWHFTNAKKQLSEYITNTKHKKAFGQ